MRSYSISVRSRAATLVLGAVAVAVGAALFVIGLAVLVSLGVAAVVLAAGLTLRRRLSGGRMGAAESRIEADGSLNPRLEVFPERRVVGPAPPVPGPSNEGTLPASSEED